MTNSADRFGSASRERFLKFHDQYAKRLEKQRPPLSSLANDVIGAQNVYIEEMEEEVKRLKTLVRELEERCRSHYG